MPRTQKILRSQLLMVQRTQFSNSHLSWDEYTFCWNTGSGSGLHILPPPGMPDRFHQSHLYTEFRIINTFRQSHIKFSESKDLGLMMNSIPEPSIEIFFSVSDTRQMDSFVR
jgi:hypothetical protein